MKASEHLALCEGKRGGATEEERALCKELAEYEARCLRLVADLAVAEERDGEARTQAAIDGEAWEDMKARAEAAEEDVRILTDAASANEDMIERARESEARCKRMEEALIQARARIVEALSGETTETYHTEDLRNVIRQCTSAMEEATRE